MNKLISNIMNVSLIITKIPGCKFVPGTGGNSSHKHFSQVFKSFLNFNNPSIHAAIHVQTPVAFRVNSNGPGRAWQGAKAVPMWPTDQAIETLSGNLPGSLFLMLIICDIGRTVIHSYIEIVNIFKPVNLPKCLEWILRKKYFLVECYILLWLSLMTNLHN